MTGGVDLVDSFVNQDRLEFQGSTALTEGKASSHSEVIHEHVAIDGERALHISA